jgi:hypothetical protein
MEIPLKDPIRILEKDKTVAKKRQAKKPVAASPVATSPVAASHPLPKRIRDIKQQE